MAWPVQNNISAIYAYSTEMDVHGSNIANVNTDGYKRCRADIVELSNSSVGTDASRVDTPGPAYCDPVTQAVREMSNVNLAEELVQTIPTSIGYKANLKTISAYDELLGSVLDILG